MGGGVKFNVASENKEVATGGAGIIDGDAGYEAIIRGGAEVQLAAGGQKQPGVGGVAKF